MFRAPAPALLVIAHGSRDPRHAATVHALTRRVRALRPGLRVETAFLDFDTPTVAQVTSDLYRSGVREVVALPLLLTRAFHAKSDVPAVLAEATSRLPDLSVRIADVLGPSPLLVGALERRLAEAGLTPADRATTGVVLASAGSSDPEAIAVIAEIAREWRHTGWCAVRPAFASASLPRTEDAVRALRAQGCAGWRWPRTSSPPGASPTASWRARKPPGRTSCPPSSARRRNWPASSSTATTRPPRRAPARRSLIPAPPPPAATGPSAGARGPRPGAPALRVAQVRAAASSARAVRSSIDIAPGGRPSRAKMFAAWRSVSFTGVGTPWRRPSREISPLR